MPLVLNRIRGERKGLEEIVNQGQTIKEAEAVPTRCGMDAKYAVLAWHQRPLDGRQRCSRSKYKHEPEPRP